MAEQGQTRDHSHETQRPRQQQPEQTAHGLDALGQATVDPAAAFGTVKHGPPTSITPQAVLALQRAAGNQAVQRLLASKKQQQPLGRGGAQAAPVGTLASGQSEGGSGGFELDCETADRINGGRNGGQPLESSLQAEMGERMGYDFGRVRVHTDVEADELSQQLSAKAFTTGQDIFFNQGAYDPGSSSGRGVIAHELSHVVQQESGVVSGIGTTVRPGGDDLEREADELGQRVADEEYDGCYHGALEGGIQQTGVGVGGGAQGGAGLREAVGRTSMPKKALRPPARGKPIQRVKVYPTWKDEKGVINTNIMAQPKQVKLESLGYKELHVYKGIYDQMLVLGREPTKAGKPPHNEIEFEQGEHDKLNELIGQLEPMAETVLCYESEAKTAQPWQNLDFGPVSTCVTITCILSDGTRIGAHEGWQLRVGGGAMATLKRVIGGRKLTQVIVNGVLNEWFWKEGATELACQMSPEYRQASWKPIMTTGEQGARQWEDFRKWLSGQFGQVEVKRDGEIDGERRVLRPAHCPICRSEAEHGRFHGRV